MSYVPGQTSVSIDVEVYDDAGLPVTGLVAATFPAVVYSRAGSNANVSLGALNDLALITSPWNANGLKERANGRYRLDLPNAVFSVVGVVSLWAEASGKHLIYPRLEVGDALANTVPGTYPQGTAGWALGRIGSGQIVTTSPVAVDGSLTIIQGDGYIAANGNALEWTDVNGVWPNLTAAAITLEIGNGKLVAAGTVITPTGTGKKVRVELTTVQTAALPPGKYQFAVVATIYPNRVTLVGGTRTAPSTCVVIGREDS